MAVELSDSDKSSDIHIGFAYQSTASESWKEKRVKPIGNTFLNVSCNGSSKRSKSWSHPCSWHMEGVAHDAIEWQHANAFSASQSQHFQLENPPSLQLTSQGSHHDWRQHVNLSSVTRFPNLLPHAIPAGIVSAPSNTQKDNPSSGDFEHSCGQLRRSGAVVLPSLQEAPLMHMTLHNFLQHQRVHSGFQALPFTAGAAFPDVHPVRRNERPGNMQEDLRVAACVKQRLRQQQVNEATIPAAQRGFELTGTIASMSQEEEMSLDWCHAQDLIVQEQLGSERCLWSGTCQTSCDEGTADHCQQGAEVGASQFTEVKVEIEENPDIPEGCTLMVRNIPESFSTSQLVTAIENLGLGQNIQCVYMPQTFKRGRARSNGYAFVNLDTIAAAEALGDAWHNFVLVPASSEAGWKQKPSSNRLNVAWANVQGLRENLILWTKSKTSRIRNNHFRPLLFNKAQELLLR